MIEKWEQDHHLDQWDEQNVELNGHEVQKLKQNC